MNDAAPEGPHERTVGPWRWMDRHERAWREGWAFAYSGAANLYGDDGELQDNSTHPPIDWMRDPPIVIRDKIRERAMRRLMEPTAVVSGSRRKD